LNDRKLSEASRDPARDRRRGRDDFEITHVTVQFECESCEPDTTLVCTQSSGNARGHGSGTPGTFAKS